MSDFLGFSNLTRPEIGLLADGSQNLSDIFSPDRRRALSNILINPENLNLINRLSESVSREDLRTASGLSTLLLPSLHLLDEVFNKKIKDILNDSTIFASPKFSLGTDAENPSLSGAFVRVPNVIIFNGSLQCESVEYRINTLGESLFVSPERRFTSISVSRTSLFNTEQWEVGSGREGYFKESSYPGTVRVRRRSHVNQIEIPLNLYIPRPTITESPSHTITLNVDNGNTGTTIPLKLLATKNTPLKIPCRMATGSVKFTFADSQSPYFFGYQIQPTQSRTGANDPAFLPLPQISQPSGSSSFTLNIDIRQTGYQNVYDLYLYLYVNPEKVTGLEFTGINIFEFNDLRDIGLIGFNNLEFLKLNGTSIKILPLWLKTLKNKLRVLDVSNDGDTYRSGLMGWFDIRNPLAIPNSSHPLYTVISYLTIPKRGAIVNEDGNGWSDTLFEKYVLNQSRTPNTDYRVFDALTELNLGDKFFGINVRLDDVFPSLRRLSWNGKFGTGGVSGANKRLFGTPPKINNNNNIIRYDISTSGAEGSILNVGTSTIITDPGHISQYKMEEFRVNGSFEGGIQQVSGVISQGSENWQEWWENTRVINISLTLASINLQPQGGTWEELQTLNLDRSGGAIFAAGSPPLKTPKLGSLAIDSTTSTGPVPSLGTAANTSELQTFSISRSNSVSTIPQAPASGPTYNYILPSFFAPNRGTGEDAHKLKTFSFSESSISGRFRYKDFKFLYNLETINVTSSGNVVGKFPEFPTKAFPEEEQKPIRVRIERGSSFYDLLSLSIDSSNRFFSRDIREIQAFNQNLAGGGTKLPNFVGTIDSQIQVVDINNCLPSRYPNTWFSTPLRDSIVSPLDPHTEISGLTINRSIYSSLGGIWVTEDDIYTLTGSGIDYRTRVLVGDSVSNSATGEELARVLSVSANVIIIDRNISSPLPAVLFFRRKDSSVSEWFKFGFTELKEFRASNCRLAGSLNIQAGFDKIADSTAVALDLSTNLISNYLQGSFNRIFSGFNRKITVNLSRNLFSANLIRVMINEIIELDRLGRFTNCKVQLLQCKLNLNSKYSSYSQSEIFPTSIVSAPDQVISLTRIEQIYIYNEVEQTDEEGNVSISRVIIGTRNIRVPGQFILSLGKYYKTQINTMQQIVEDSLGAQYKTLRGIRVDLDFDYISPSTAPTIVSTSYADLTTREQSVIDAGFDPQDLVNP
jgi:hypothetical protein